MPTPPLNDHTSAVVRALVPSPQEQCTTTARPILAAAALAAAATTASAQSVTLHWKWNRASDPITTPAPAALLPGESARVWLDVAWEAGSAADVQGFADLHVNLAANDAQGIWASTGPGFGGTQIGPHENFNWHEWGHRRDMEPWTAGAWNYNFIAGWGTYYETTGSVHAIQAGQIGAPGTSATVSSANPIIEIWRGMFTPADYTPRMIIYTGEVGSGSPHTGARLYTRAPGATGFETLSVPGSNLDLGTLEIPVLPNPSTISLLGLGALLATRRRR